MARVKLDENLPDAAAPNMRELGHDVELARDEGLAGAEDDEVLANAAADDRVFVTLDMDFADVVRHDPIPPGDRGTSSSPTATRADPLRCPLCCSASPERRH